MPQLNIKFDRHGLGDCVHFAHAVQLYKRRGYDVTVQAEENKLFIWQVAGVNIVQGGGLPDHSYHYPSGFDDLNQPDHDTNKIAFGLRNEIMPPLEEWPRAEGQGLSDGNDLSSSVPRPSALSPQRAWDELCAVRLSALPFISDEAYAEADRFLEGMPCPIICFHSRGTNWHERKSIPTETAFETILKLLDLTPGSVIVLDYDRRAPMVGDARCKGIKPTWGHVSVERLCALLERSDLLIGIDSGPFHIAALTSCKSLGVFRSLHPNRVCLPNPNATYLVSDRHADQWKRREDLWSFALYNGPEPTPDDISRAAIQLIHNIQPKESRMLTSQFAGWYEYHRVGHDRRRIELLPDGSIARAVPDDCEQQWFVRMESTGPVISISGKVGIICDCKQTDGENIFRGRWTQFERMPIELSPLPQASAIRPERIMLVANWDDDYTEIANVVLENRRQYASRHGYQIAESNYPGSWGKLNATLAVWDQADWLWCLDMDAAITNPSVKLESLLGENADIVITCDRNGISCGSMLIRTSPEVKAIFEVALKRRKDFDWPNNLWEQNALMWLFWKIKDRVQIVPQQTMNSYAAYDCPKGSQAWNIGDFVLHCAGLPNQKRIELLSEAVKERSND